MTELSSSIGKYRIIEERGRGGFATVYKALDTTLDREIALKVLDPVLTSDRAFISRFQQEARVTARLFHPNIAALFEVGQAEGRYFIAMQFIPGRNLYQLLQSGALLSFDQIVSVIQQIGAALDYAHGCGAIHRDVKPSNIVFDENDHATLTDFGIAKALQTTTIQTTTGAILGTPAYASPEQVESKPLDGRTDLYSLGVVAYELFTGKVPFMADTTPSLFYKIVHETPPPPSQVHARVAPPIEQALLKAIAKQPEERYQTGQEFGEALCVAVAQVETETAQGLCEQARSLLVQNDFDGAETALRQVQVIKAGHREAQALLKEVSRRREATQRYHELVQMVNLARAQAVELKQVDSDVADPEGVLKLLSTTPAQPAPTPPALASAPAKPRLVIWKVVVAGLLILAGVAAFAVGHLMPSHVINYLANDATGMVELTQQGARTLELANVVIGFGAGSLVGGVAFLASLLIKR
jgi:hypothetical protein